MVCGLWNRPRRIHVHSGWFVVLAIFAAILLGVLPSQANAQSTPVTITKSLCKGSTCRGLPIVGVGVALYYKIVLNNPSSAAATVTILDSLPAGFQLAGYACATSAGAGTTLTPSTVQTWVVTQTLPAGGHLECVLAGSFAGAATGASNVAQIVDSANHQTVLRSSNIVSTNIDLLAPLPSNLTVTKTANPSAIDISVASQQVTYTITITNAGLEDLYLGQMLTLEDQLSLPPLGVVVNASLVGATCAVTPSGGGSACLAPVPVFAPAMPVLVGPGAPTPFARWGYPTGSAGLLKAGHKIVLTVVVAISRVSGVTCILAADSDGINNNARLVLTLPAATPGGSITTISDSKASDNIANSLLQIQTGATQIDPACNAPFQPPPPVPPVLEVTKIQESPVPATDIPWSPVSTVRYRVTVRNVSTIPGLTIRNIRVEDWVRAGTETPPFTATRVNHTCPSCTVTYAPVPGQPLLGNDDAKQMFGATLVQGTGLGLKQSASFIIYIQYSNPGCDSYPAIAPKTITNEGRVTSWEEVVGTTVTPRAQMLIRSATTRMRAPPRCPLTVEKTASSTRILFGNPNMNSTTNYTIVYRNPTRQPYMMGTMIDAIRIVPPAAGLAPYAVQLRVDYGFNCTVTQGTVTGYPRTNPNGPNGVDTTQVVVTQLPQQGVRLIRNTEPVAFGPNSRLQCSVSAWVFPPPAADPYCSFGELENAAVLDGSFFYDPNTPWPPSTTPGMFASVRGALPRCHNLVVNKTASPAWTWQKGGPLSWTLDVTNAGPPVVAGDKLLVTDTLDGGPAASSGTTCIPPAGNPAAPCDYSWSPAPSAGNPSVLNVDTLATGGGIRTTMALPNAPASVGPGGEVCNAAAASVSQFVLPPYTLSYWKTRQTLSGKACIPVLDTRTLTVTKTVTSPTGMALPATFTINVGCTNANPDFNGPTATLNLAPNGSGTVQHIPVGSTCAVDESPAPAAPPGNAACANPAWTTAYLPGARVTISDGNNAVTVANAITCGATDATLLIRKFVAVNGDPLTSPRNLNNVPWLPHQSFPVTVTCGSAAPVALTLTSANNYQIALAAPIGETCTVHEPVPPFPAMSNCSWSVSYPQGQSAAIVPGNTVLDVYNEQVCSRVGSVTVIMRTVFPAGAPVFASAPVDVGCTPRGPNVTITVPANGTAAVNGILIPATCTVTQRIPPSNVPGCQWIAVQRPAQPVAVGESPPDRIVSFDVSWVC